MSMAFDGAGDDPVRLLLVEDDPTVAQMYRLKLEMDGYLVEVVRDGESALQAVESAPPDLIFLDMRLPGMHGITVLEKLRQSEVGRQIPVVILSANEDGAMGHRALELGALEWRLKNRTTPSQLSRSVPGWKKGRRFQPDDDPGAA
jgi:CheY-like chemotaxis protein